MFSEVIPRARLVHDHRTRFYFLLYLYKTDQIKLFEDNSLYINRFILFQQRSISVRKL